KTVEVHLTSIYRKLGISARTALPGALTRSGRDELILGGPSLNLRGGILGIIPMCGRPGRGTLVRMAAQILHIAIDIRVDGDQIAGHAGDGSGEPRPFLGWLGLIGALALLTGDRQGQAGGPAAAGDPAAAPVHGDPHGG